MNQANVHAGLGAGRFRDPWEIKKLLSAKGTNMTKEARKIGISPQLFHRTVSGTANNRKVLEHLRRIGCPDKALSLPSDMKG